MGSDHGTKSGDGIFFLFQQCYRYRLSLLKLLGVLTLLPVVVKVKTYWLSRIALLVPAPEKLLSHSFSSHSLIQRIPLHCRDVAQRFLHCQEVGNETWVLACHRRWCDSRIGGHCEMCAGIGDRNRFMLMEATEALGKCYRVELDYAHPGELIVDSAIYQDPAGWWGNWVIFVPMTLHNDYRPIRRTPRWMFEPVERYDIFPFFPMVTIRSLTTNPVFSTSSSSRIDDYNINWIGTTKKSIVTGDHRLGSTIERGMSYPMA